MHHTNFIRMFPHHDHLRQSLILAHGNLSAPLGTNSLFKTSSEKERSKPFMSRENLRFLLDMLRGVHFGFYAPKFELLNIYGRCGRRMDGTHRKQCHLI